MARACRVGQSRRLSLARILVADYDLIPADEPRSAGCRQRTAHCANPVQLKRQEKKTLVLYPRPPHGVARTGLTRYLAGGRLAGAGHWLEGGHHD